MIPCCVPFQWQLCTIMPTDSEDDALDQSRPMVPRDKILRSYIVWRRAALIFLFPLIVAEFMVKTWAFVNEIETLKASLFQLTFLGWSSKGMYICVPVYMCACIYVRMHHELITCLAVYEGKYHQVCQHTIQSYLHAKSIALLQIL
jgi:hypothetical protein